MKLDEIEFARLLRQALAAPGGEAWRALVAQQQSGTADVASAVSLIEDVMIAVVAGEKPETFIPAIRATLVGLQKNVAAECAKIADDVDDLSGVGYSISLRFGLR
jgi:hypothetical protein